VESARRDHELIPLAKAAREEGVSIRIIRRDAASGTLETYQFGSPRIWVRRAEVRLWLERHRQPARTSGEPCES
jgi:hypothetical protein